MLRLELNTKLWNWKALITVTQLHQLSASVVESCLFYCLHSRKWAQFDWWGISLIFITGSRRRKTRSWSGSYSCHSPRSNVTTAAMEAGLHWGAILLIYSVFNFYFLNPEILCYCRYFMCLSHTRPATGKCKGPEYKKWEWHSWEEWKRKKKEEVLWYTLQDETKGSLCFSFFYWLFFTVLLLIEW